MVKLNRIYTKTGDDGTTGLASGDRRAKDDARVAAYGTVDEANSVIGLARLHAAGDPLDAMLATIQNDLFDVGADLATPGDDFGPDSKSLRATPAQVARLEAEIDAMNERLAPLTSFILPGGTALAAYLHLARTVVRRAERLTDHRRAGRADQLQRDPLSQPPVGSSVRRRACRQPRRRRAVGTRSQSLALCRRNQQGAGMATAARAHTDELRQGFFATRTMTVALAAPLSDADATVQSMPDASPAKWHLAHTTWFLETFVLAPLGVPAFDARFGYLFNSYYEAAGPRHARAARGLLTRPSLAEVLGWREHVDAALDRHWDRLDGPLRDLIELAIAHEQQHQELLLTDILHLFAANPLSPAVYDAPPPPAAAPAAGWTGHAGGTVTVGHARGGFAFDCEGPAHAVLLAPFALADAVVTNAEWDAFIADGGYDEPRLWLSDGWAWRQREGIVAPAPLARRGP